MTYRTAAEVMAQLFPVDAGVDPETLRRHTFKTAARSCMDSSWHDRLTGHAHRTVGETYGDYDPATMKRKMDMISFGLETQADA